MSKKNRIRLYINSELNVGSELVCDEKQSHYLFHVMRLAIDEDVYVFNGKDGEFCAKIIEQAKKKCTLKVESKYCDFEKSPDMWLLFAILKKDNTDLVVEKATELGVRKIIPVISEYTSNSKTRTERLQSIAIEASEQCRRQDVPEVLSEIELKKLLATWDKNRKLIYLDESLKSLPCKEQMPKCESPVAILTGPEGGFSEKELEILRNLDYAYGISLGKRILRAETASICAMACWQAYNGDWQ